MEGSTTASKASTLPMNILLSRMNLFNVTRAARIRTPAHTCARFLALTHLPADALPSTLKEHEGRWARSESKSERTGEWMGAVRAAAPRPHAVRHRGKQQLDLHRLAVLGVPGACMRGYARATARARALVRPGARMRNASGREHLHDRGDRGLEQSDPKLPDLLARRRSLRYGLQSARIAIERDPTHDRRRCPADVYTDVHVSVCVCTYPAAAGRPSGTPTT
jgi:hypothetical protein